ncbi:unnamed protein product [Brassica napus]|uniref:Fucosyltransferase n=1 Tax=Brassica napus TaxID=3708 RepID=A0A816S6T1_BRANA|nr:unnamed protein product [Brassica napus]
MGPFSNLRGPRIGATHDELPLANDSSSSSSPSSHSSSIRRKLSNLLPICVALVVIAEIGFLGRLDKVALVDTLTDFFTQSPSLSPPSRSERKIGVVGTEKSCEEWLRREDSVTYSRDFRKNPIFISGGAKDFQSCSVDCTFEASAGKTADATFGLGHKPETLGIIRSMESAQYYPDNDLSQARRRGYDVVMTTSLSSDVPVGYFSWAEYDIMAPVQPKTERAIAAAFISNCGARNFRLQALEALMRTRIKIDSYGGCHRNRDGKVDKVEALKRYKFSLAFENTNEEDYVTEKFFQSLVAGSVPVVVGAPNIEDFAPASGSILQIKSMEDVEPVAKRMKFLADNPAAYNHTLRWKYEGPSDSFKALVDMAAVHSSCRLCIFLATRIQEQEEKSPSFKKRPCKCTRGGSDTVYHVFVRERGRFEMESIFLRGKNLTLEALESAVVAKFKSLKHEPVWKKERPASLKGDNELRVHKIYPLGLTQRQALYNFKFEGNSSLSTHIQHNPCAKFEIKDEIERCIKKYMNLEQTITYLHEKYHIHHVITSAIWERLQEGNPDFFEEYYKRCEVARQIAAFNDLLAQQVDLMHKLREIELSNVAPVTQLQQSIYQFHHHNDQVNHHHQHHHHQDHIYDQWIASNDFAYIENSVSSLIDASWIAAPPQSNIFNYGTDFQDMMSIEQFTRELDQQQQILQLKSQQPEHLTDQQVEYCLQKHDYTTLPVQQLPPQSLASLNSLDFAGDGFTNNNGSTATTGSDATKETRKKNQ